jgi:hypothetical protein
MMNFSVIIKSAEYFNHCVRIFISHLLFGVEESFGMFIDLERIKTGLFELYFKEDSLDVWILDRFVDVRCVIIDLRYCYCFILM